MNVNKIKRMNKVKNIILKLIIVFIIIFFVSVLTSCSTQYYITNGDYKISIEQPQGLDEFEYMLEDLHTEYNDFVDDDSNINMIVYPTKTNIEYLLINDNKDTICVAHRTKYGNKTGEWIFCSKTEVVAIIHYKHNKRIGVWEFYEYGEIVQEYNYTKNMKKYKKYKLDNATTYFKNTIRLITK